MFCAFLKHVIDQQAMFLSDSSSYCATLYDGLKSCPQDRHVHVLCDTDYIAHLIGRAEPELAGGYAILVSCCRS